MGNANFFLLNIFLNSLLAFFTAALLIETLIFLCRIQPGRASALLRMIPILKLPVDLFLYDFSRWSYLQGVNPLHCVEGTRTLSIFFDWTASSIQCTVPGNMTFTLSDILGYMMHPSHLQIFSSIFILLSAYFFIKKCRAYHRHLKTVRSTTVHSKLSTKKIGNSRVLAEIKRGKYSIFASPLVRSSPFVAGVLFPCMYMPTDFAKELSKREYAAVLAHEIEHIRHRDIFIRLLLDILSSLFWWIPTRWLQNRIEEGQEISCDYQCRKYGIDPLDLATALYKSAHYTKSHPAPTFVNPLTRHKTAQRIQLLLNPLPKQFQPARLICTSLAVSLAFVCILFGRFWIF